MIESLQIEVIMRNRIAFLAPLLLSLAGCGQASPPPPPAPPPPAAEHAEPVNPAFIGRIWTAATPGSPRGSILVFLPDRMLLMDSCFETYRLSQWGVAGDKIRWIEDTIPIEAEVVTPTKDELILRITGQDREQRYIAADAPYVCPDMPK